MAKGRLVIVVILLTSCTTLALAVDLDSGKQGSMKYTLYIGLNDKDTYQQEISTEDAERVVTAIVLNYVDGFTQMMAKGVFKDDTGVITYENSLIYEFLDAHEEQITKIMDEVLVALNQTSILVERAKVDFEFYEGVKP
jgi:hypothetical protein